MKYFAVIMMGVFLVVWTGLFVDTCQRHKMVDLMRQSAEAPEAPESVGPYVVPGYVNPVGITDIDQLKVGETFKTCGFEIYHGKMYVTKHHTNGTAFQCVGVRRDPDGLVGILPKDMAKTWTEDASLSNTSTPVVRIEYVKTMDDVK